MAADVPEALSEGLDEIRVLFLETLHVHVALNGISRNQALNQTAEMHTKADHGVGPKALSGNRLETLDRTLDLPKDALGIEDGDGLDDIAKGQALHKVLMETLKLFGAKKA